MGNVCLLLCGLLQYPLGDYVVGCSSVPPVVVYCKYIGTRGLGTLTLGKRLSGFPYGLYSIIGRERTPRFWFWLLEYPILKPILYNVILYRWRFRNMPWVVLTGLMPYVRIRGQVCRAHHTTILYLCVRHSRPAVQNSRSYLSTLTMPLGNSVHQLLSWLHLGLLLGQSPLFAQFTSQTSCVAFQCVGSG